jgi:Na+/H+ antiporter NhaA
MTDGEAGSTSLSGRTAWARALQTPVRTYLRTESGGAAVLLVATLAALAWANLAPASYATAWQTPLSVGLGSARLSLSLHEWVNSGLMTFFFLVVGLEARREFDMGELRDRRRVALPLAAGLGGMLVPILLFLAFNAGEPSARGWGVAMSTDTAFALGLLALVGRGLPDPVRVFLLTVVVVDDVVALLVIAVAYSDSIALRPLAVAAGVFVLLLLLRRADVRVGLLYFAGGAAAWLALHASGVDPVVLGLAMGLATTAYPPARIDLERATGLFRLFREQPTPELARSATVGVARALSPNERLQTMYHPWTGYGIVPLFALANAGIDLSPRFLAEAVTSPITVGVFVGYVVGKPVGVLGTAWLVTRVTRGRLRPTVGWAAIGGCGALGGIGFTVALLIATLAFSGRQLQEAKLGVLSAALGASVLSWLVFRITRLLSPPRRTRALLGSADTLVDLAVPVDIDRDHVRGPHEALVTLVEYGDFECPYCGLAEPVVRELLASFGDLRYVWRHLPLSDVHPQAQLAAEAAEAAAAQGAFWAMHDLLLARQDELRPVDLARHAAELGLDVDRFGQDLRRHEGAGRVAEDVDSAGLSGVSGTPTFFVNGIRQYGAYDIASLTTAVHTAKARRVAGTGSAPGLGAASAG